MDSLSQTQRDALAELRQVTNGEDINHEIAVLESVDWDVARAAAAIFDAEPVAGPSSERKPLIEQFDVDDSQQRGPTYPRPRVGLGLGHLLALPFTFSLGLVAQLLNFIFRVLRIPFPRVNLALFRRAPPRPPLADDPASVTDRWVRELEEETGALCVSHAAASSVASEPGPSSRPAGSDSKTLLLPDFYRGSYESALNVAQREARVLCVILLSGEHDDVPEFRRHVLTDRDFVQTLTDNNFIVWAGDVRDREAYETSLKLSVTTYPFVGFISLHPRRGSTSTSGMQLTVFSYHEGPATHPAGPTSAVTLTQHIRDTLLPRVGPILQRIQNEHNVRAQERALREEQDRAYEAAQRRDLERVLARRAEVERASREAAAARAAAEAAANAERSKARWRAVVRPTLVPVNPRGHDSVRIAVRLPSGQRVAREFPRDSALSGLYAWVDEQMVPAEGADGVPPSAEYEHAWDFRLAIAYPRVEVPWKAHESIGSIEALHGGATLVAEPIASASGQDSEDEE